MNFKEKVFLGLDLKNYIVSTRACRFKEGYIFESKFGKANFNFFDLNYHKIVLTFKKISGNGKLVLKLGADQQKVIESVVLLKSYQSIELDLEEDTLLEISRTSESTGEIILHQITAIPKSLTSESQGEDLNKWKSIIKKCGNYHQLRLIGNKLLAGEGSWIENGNLILQIETEPSGLFLRENNRIKFLGSCEIKKMELDYSQRSNFSKKNELYQHFEVPTPVSPFVKEVNKSVKEYTCQIFDTEYHQTFDSKKSKLFVNKLAKLTNSNAKDYLILRRGGVFNIPIANLESNCEYQIECTLQKLNGNGKIHLSIVSDYCSSSSTLCVAEAQLQTHQVQLFTKNGTSFKLQLAMKEDGIGEVLVSRILVNKKSLILSPDFNNPLFKGKFFFSDSLDDIKERTQNAALLELEKYEPYQPNYEINGCVEATYFYGKWWLSKVLPFFPNVRAKNLNEDSLKNRESADVVISSLDTLKFAERIWLMEFKDPLQAWQIQILTQVKYLLTPSLKNYFFLKENFPKMELELCQLSLPSILSFSENEKFNQIVYLEKQLHHTKNLIQSWQENDPKLYILGSNLKVPSYIQIISKYENYVSIMKQIQQSKVVLDLADNNHYDCGFLNVCRNLGLAMITNNQKYFTFSNVLPLKSFYQDNKCYVDLEALKNKVQKAMSFPIYRNDVSSDLSACLKKLLGKN